MQCSGILSILMHEASCSGVKVRISDGTSLRTLYSFERVTFVANPGLNLLTSS